ncbi:hypothetical protein KIL84_009351 [Mauremys mutica]|uniref:Uncharacterized protein n=1 Tax=Mauremys mutica TaxID=74926 RepID=A0A9D3XK53_9SAUR|nr:hypothetical protein KIL84_009351 [Mauremys mutica]
MQPSTFYTSSTVYWLCPHFSISLSWDEADFEDSRKEKERERENPAWEWLDLRQSGDITSSPGFQPTHCSVSGLLQNSLASAPREEQQVNYPDSQHSQPALWALLASSSTSDSHLSHIAIGRRPPGCFGMGFALHLFVPAPPRVFIAFLHPPLSVLAEASDTLEPSRQIAPFHSP